MGRIITSKEVFEAHALATQYYQQVTVVELAAALDISIRDTMNLLALNDSAVKTDASKAIQLVRRRTDTMTSEDLWNAFVAKVGDETKCLYARTYDYLAKQLTTRIRQRTTFSYAVATILIDDRSGEAAKGWARKHFGDTLGDGMAQNMILLAESPGNSGTPDKFLWGIPLTENARAWMARNDLHVFIPEEAAKNLASDDTWISYEVPETVAVPLTLSTSANVITSTGTMTMPAAPVKEPPKQVAIAPVSKNALTTEQKQARDYVFSKARATGATDAEIQEMYNRHEDFNRALSAVRMMTNRLTGQKKRASESVADIKSSIRQNVAQTTGQEPQPEQIKPAVAPVQHPQAHRAIPVAPVSTQPSFPAAPASTDKPVSSTDLLNQLLGNPQQF